MPTSPRFPTRALTRPSGLPLWRLALSRIGQRDPGTRGRSRGHLDLKPTPPRFVTRPWRLGAENTDTYGKQELHEKVARVTALLPRVFEWARAIHPTQPLTSGVCYVESNLDGWNLGTLAQIQLRESDIVTFRNYGGPEAFPEAGEVAEALWSTGHLRRVYGPFGRGHLRGRAADREGGAGRDDQLGTRGLNDNQSW